MSNLYRILLYYKFISIHDHETIAKEHLKLCEELQLKGRILIAPEGINGTVSGTEKATDAYISYMNEHPLFGDISFKVDDYHQHAFKKMHVRSKKELVTFRLDHEIDIPQKTGEHLKPKDFYNLMQQEDVIVLDGRNEYEYNIGHFRGAIRPKVSSFRGFPTWIRENLSKYKDRKIITYCTGGIRCEKLTAFMKEEGFSDVAQLEGGIVTYGKDPEVRGANFDGKCYVFDQRISVPINQNEEVIVGKCHHCQNPSDHYINCNYDPCHQQHIICKTCEIKHQGYCSSHCAEADQALEKSS